MLTLPTEGDGGFGVMKIPCTKSGKCGGMVYQNSRHGQICYEAFVPFNPNTLSQQRVRKNFRGIGELWSALSEWQRELWIREAATRMTRKRLGQCGPMTGWNYFVQVNQRRLNRGLPPLQFPPEYWQRLDATVAAAIAATGAGQPLLGSALFLQANGLLVTRTDLPAGVSAGLPPPCRALELAHS